MDTFSEIFPEIGQNDPFFHKFSLGAPQTPSSRIFAHFSWKKDPNRPLKFTQTPLNLTLTGIENLLNHFSEEERQIAGARYRISQLMGVGGGGAGPSRSNLSLG